MKKDHIKKIRIGKSNFPLAHQLDIISNNLRVKYNRSVKICIEKWSHTESVESIQYTLSLIPGFKDECTIYNFSSWTSLVNQYKFLMKRK